MGVGTRLRAAWGAMRAPEASMPAGPVAAEGGMNEVGGATYAAILSGNGNRLPPGEYEALSTPASLQALEILTGIFAMTPVIYYRKTAQGGKDRADGEPEFELFHDRPNATQSPFLFKEMMLGDMLMQGRFGAYVHRSALYRPSALSRVNPLGIGVSQSWDRQDGAELFFDVALPDGSQDRLTRNDFFYVPGFSRDGVLGVQRLRLLRDTFAAAAATSQFAARFWENNAQPSTILTTKQKVGEADKARIKSDWLSRFAGSRNAGGVAVLDQELDAKFLSHNNRDSQYVEVRQFSVVELARAWGVPPHLIFELSKATFSNIEQQSLELIMYHMMRHYERVASAMTHYFGRPGYFFEFLPDAILKGDIKSRYEAYGVAIDKGMLNPNEARARENMNSRPGGEKYRIGSGSMIEGETPAAPAKPPVPQE